VTAAFVAQGKTPPAVLHAFSGTGVVQQLEAGTSIAQAQASYRQPAQQNDPRLP